MQATTLSPTPVLEVWHHCADTRSTAWVYPDGCCDLIWHAPPHEAPTWFVTALADTNYAVDCHAQHAMLGFRMRPGIQLNAQCLLKSVAGLDGQHSSRVQALITDITRVDGRVDEALSCIAQVPSVFEAQRTLGVSERTLERLLKAATGRPPNYWRQLARARRAASEVFGSRSLGNIALENGYTDQAHMGRDFQRWFGASPGYIRQHEKTFVAIIAAGYGT